MSVDDVGNRTTENIVLPQLVSQEVQWIELYNTTRARDNRRSLSLLYAV